MVPLFSTCELPEYHDGFLLVQMRPAGALQPVAQMMGLHLSGHAGPFATPGMAALSFYERAGMVKRVTPIRPASLAIPAAGLNAAAILLASPGYGDAPNAGVGLHLIEIERGQDLSQLQLALANDPSVASVSKVPIRYLTGRPRSSRAMGDRSATGTSHPGLAPAVAPPMPNTMWNLQKIRWSEARAIPGFKDATALSVAVLDTGIDTRHPDLQGGVIESYVHTHPDLPNASSDQDLIGHGTHVSGTIAAGIGNGLGINGICQCRLRVWKIFDDVSDLWKTQTGYTFVYFVNPVMYLRALLDCIDARVDVVNLSIGGPGAPSAAEAQAFRDLIANGTVVVAAMGNDRGEGSPTSYPAAISGVIAVGATGITDKLTDFSNRGNHISICAPGYAIWSTLPTYPGQFGFGAIIDPDGRPREGKPNRRETNYDAWPGTSMASPHVAASAALYIANAGKTLPVDVRRALTQTVDKVPDMNGDDFNSDYGYGRLNLEALIRSAIEPAPVTATPARDTDPLTSS